MVCDCDISGPLLNGVQIFLNLWHDGEEKRHRIKYHNANYIMNPVAACVTLRKAYQPLKADSDRKHNLEATTLCNRDVKVFNASKC